MSTTRRVVSLDSYGSRRTDSFGDHSHSDERSYSSASVMQPLNFNRVHEDIAHPLSSLRSCSEFGFHGLQNSGQQQEGNGKKSLWKKFIRWASSTSSSSRKRSEHIPQESIRRNDYRHETYRTESRRSESFILPERASSRSQSGEGKTSPFCIPPSKKVEVPAHPSFMDEIGFGMEYVFGFHPNKGAPKEIELRDLKNPSAIAQMAIYREPTEFPGLPMQRTLSLRSLQGSVDESRSSLSQHSDTTSAHSGAPLDYDLTSVQGLCDLFTHILNPYTAFIRSRCLEGDNELFYSLQCQPFSSVLYLRGMLSAGMNNTIFHTYALLFLPEMSTDMSVSTLCFQRLIVTILIVQVILNVLATPTRAILHYNCWLSSRCFDVETACQALQDLIESDMWMLNRAFAWVLDCTGIFALVCGQLYLWYDAWLVDSAYEDNQALTTVVIGMCATNLVSFLIRAVVAIVYFLSFMDTRRGPNERRRGGLSNFDLNRMPTFVFSCKDDVVNSECAICLMEFEMGEMLISLPCHHQHSFHANCIREWLVRQNVCPLCQKTC